MSKKITDLTAATTPLAGTELVEIVQSGVSKKVAASYLAGGGAMRELLTAARTYYVRTDGSDSNNGLANTSGGAFLTLQKAYNTALALDTGGYTVTIEVGDGTYTAGMTIDKPLVGGGSLIVDGNTTTPANCIVSLSSGSCFAVSYAPVTIRGFKLVNSGGYGILTSYGGKAFPSAMEYGACSAHHNRASGSGSQIELTGAIAISGDAQTFIAADGSGANTQLYQSTVTFSGTRTFSTAFAWSTRNAGLRTFTMTWAGTHASTVGKKYDVTMNSTLELNGVTLPGGTAGTYATGGQVSA